MKRKINRTVRILFVLSVALILLASQLPQVTYASGLQEYLRVGLYYSSTAISSCTIESKTGFILGTAENDSFEEGMPLPAYSKLVVSVEDDSVVLRDEDGVLISADIGTNGCLMPTGYLEEDRITIQKAVYRGGVTFVADANDQLTVINYVPLEQYLYGVVHLEMSQSNPTEALKAQAVTARSFAIANLGKHSDYGFDVCNSTNCQVYGGCSAEYESTVIAVDQTEGKLIRYQGEPVAVYYFKNSGGYTQSSQEVWSGAVSYLSAVKDPYSPEYPWTASIDFDTIAQKLTSAGYTIGEVTSVQITERNGTGAVAKLTIKGTDGTAVLEKEKIRTTFGTAVVKSRLFNLGLTYTGGNTTSLSLQGSTTTNVAGSTVSVIGMDGVVVTKNVSELSISNGTVVNKASASGSSGDTEIDTDGTLELSGLGYGHGVGMPQDSAIVMANQGKTYEEILKYFFTGVEIE